MLTTLSRAHRLFLIRDQFIGPFVLNLGLNVAGGWFAFRSFAQVPLWGLQSAGLDLIATSFLLPFGITLLGSPIIAWMLRRGKLAPIESSEGLRRVRSLPPSLLLRSLLLGLVPTLVFGPLIALALNVVYPHGVELKTYLALKGLYAGALAAAVSPIMALHVLTSTSWRPSSTNPVGSPAKS